MGIIKNYKNWNKLFESANIKVSDIKYTNNFLFSLYGNDSDFKIDNLEKLITKNVTDDKKSIHLEEVISKMSEEEQKNIPEFLKSDDKKLAGLATGPQAIINLVRTKSGANAIIKSVIKNSGINKATSKDDFISIDRDKLKAKGDVLDIIYGPSVNDPDYDADDVMEFKIAISNLKAKFIKSQARREEIIDGEKRTKVDCILKVAFDLTIDHPIINATTAGGGPKTVTVDEGKLVLTLWPGLDTNYLNWNLISIGINFNTPIVTGIGINCSYSESNELASSNDL